MSAHLLPWYPMGGARICMGLKVVDDVHGEVGVFHLPPGFTEGTALNCITPHRGAKRAKALVAALNAGGPQRERALQGRER